MSESVENERLGRVLAALLRYGTWAASTLIAIGMLSGAASRISGTADAGTLGYGLMKTGVAVLIMLPVARVLVLFGIFLCRRDLAYALISACVLAILGFGVWIGMHS